MRIRDAVFESLKEDIPKLWNKDDYIVQEPPTKDANPWYKNIHQANL